MGADGGSIPDRRDLVKTRGKAEKTDRELQRERFFLCGLSRNPLTKPVVADPLGKLYNKDAILEFLLDKSTYGDGEEICKYVKGVKDLLTLNLMPNPAREGEGTSASRAPFVCWLSLKEMTGAIPFIALRGCGCVFSDSAVRAVIPNLVRGPADDSAADAEPAQATCPNCGKEFDPTSPRAVLPIYASPETQTVLLEQLLVDRAAAKANKKRKAEKGDKDKSDKGDKDKGDSDEGKEKKKKKKTETKAEAAAHPAPSIKASTVGSSVHAMLAEQEKKRLAAKEGMSDAVKAMFHASGDNKGDAVDFFGRTFNRYA